MYIFVIKRLLNMQLIIFRNSIRKWTILWKIKTIEKLGMEIGLLCRISMVLE